MPYITITHAAHDAIRAAATNPGPAFDMPCNVDGTRDVWIADDTIARLHEMAFSDESYSDTILRLLATAHGRAQ